MKRVFFFVTAGITMVLSVIISQFYYWLARETLTTRLEQNSFNLGSSQAVFFLSGLGLGLILVLIEWILFAILPPLLRRGAAGAGPRPA